MKFLIMKPAIIFYFVNILFIGLIDSRLHDSVGCSSEEFSCKNGQCISKLEWCDGISHCKDNSDEDYCRHGLYDLNNCYRYPSFFVCDDGGCIPKEGQCDGLKSCEDGSDEYYCDSTTVKPYLETFKLETSTEQESDFQQNRNDQQNANSYSVESNYFSDSRSEHDKENLKLETEYAHSWILSQWSEDVGWKDETARAIVALQLSKPQDFGKNGHTMMMNKQLDIQLSLALKGNSSKAISLFELSHYINALSATCRNPRNFNEYDLVSVLRERVDHLNLYQAFVSPYVYITLCIQNSTKYEDILNIQRIVRSKLSVADNFDMLSLSLLAVSCATRQPAFHYPNIRADIVNQIIGKINRSGTPKSIYELSLLTQALSEAKVDPSHWNRTEAMYYILGEQSGTGQFHDFLATYYTIPLLSGKSILDLAAHCNKSFSQAIQHSDLMQSKINVVYSLNFGYPAEMTQKIKLQVVEGSNFLDVMRLAQEENPYFKFKLDETKDTPFVYSIGDVPYDAERGIYWTLYVYPEPNRSDIIHEQKDIRQYIPRNNEECVFWLRPIKK